MSISYEQRPESLNADTPRVSVDHTSATNTPTPSRPTQSSTANGGDSATRQRVDSVLQSDSGVSILLTRLKQSINSATDFAAFLKRRSALEEQHAQGLNKLVHATQEVIRRPDGKQGSFGQNYGEITQIHKRMADHGQAFAIDLHTMTEDLQDLAANAERGRKHWKHSGLSAEARVRDAVDAMHKAMEKSYSLGDQYDRARGGDRPGGRFGLKKSGTNAEEDILRKAQAADNDYAQKVHAAQTQRAELLNSSRPQAVKALTDLIAECDAGLSTQMQKYSALSERLILSNGLCINPLKNQTTGSSPQNRSLREAAQSINHEQDLHEYVLNNQGPPEAKIPEIKYEKHQALASPIHSQRPFGQTQPSFNASQPQFGYPERTNTGLSTGYDQGSRDGRDGQLTGVTSNANRDGAPPMPGHWPSYGPQQNGSYQQQYGNAPSLPPLSLGSGSGGFDQGYRQDGQRPDGISPLNSNDQRAISSPLSMNQSPAHQFGGPSDPRYGGPTGLNQNRSVSGPGRGPGSYQGSMAPSGPVNNYQNQPTPVYNDDGRANGGQQGTPYRQEPQAPPVPTTTNVYSADARGPQGPANNYQPENRGPTSQQSQYPPRTQSAQNNHNQSLGHTASNSVASIFNRPSNGPTQTSPRTGGRASDMKPSLPANHPVFGFSLDDLFRRDGSAVPTIVYQCVQAVDLFGLNTEGVYRTSGSAPHIMEMKAMFDHDSSLVDFRNPTAFHNDIASVTTLLKHFLRDLPDPLLTGANYTPFIQAAKIDDDIVRRDSLHAIINSLPDPNYATLRVLCLHLRRVAMNSDRNRMTFANLAICFGPTLMGGQSAGGGGASSGANGQGDIRDAGWQARVVETILVNTLQVFDDDE